MDTGLPYIGDAESLNRIIEIAMSLRAQHSTYGDVTYHPCWRLASVPSNHLVLSMLRSIFVTTISDVRGMPFFAIAMAEFAVHVKKKDGSFTMRDGSMYVRSYGTLLLAGRLAISVIGVAQHIFHATGTPCVVNSPVSGHIDFSCIMYTVKLGASTRLCTLTLILLQLLGYL